MSMHDHIVKSYDDEQRHLLQEILRMGHMAAAQLDAAFLWEAIRTVAARTATIKFQGNVYETAPELAGQAVTIAEMIESIRSLVPGARLSAGRARPAASTRSGMWMVSGTLYGMPASRILRRAAGAQALGRQVRRPEQPSSPGSRRSWLPW